MDKKKDQLVSTLLKLLRVPTTLQIQVDRIKSLFEVKYQSVDKNKIAEIFKENGIDHLTNEIIQNYEKHFSEEDIQSLINFFSSEIGRKMRDEAFLEKIEKTQSDWVVAIETKIFEAEFDGKKK